MPLNKSIGTGDLDKNDEEIFATYWVVTECRINHETKFAHCELLGFIKKAHYVNKKRPIMLKSFDWGIVSPINPFLFTKGGGLLAQMQSAIIAYKARGVDGQIVPGEFADAIIADGV